MDDKGLHEFGSGVFIFGRRVRLGHMQLEVDAESAARVMYDPVGFAIVVGSTYDQLDLVNLACTK